MTIPRAMAVELAPPEEGVGAVLHVLLPSLRRRHVPQRMAAFGPRQPAPGGQDLWQETPPIIRERERESVCE